MYKVPSLTVNFDNIKGKISSTFKTLKIENVETYLEELLTLEQVFGSSRFRFQITAKSTQELLMLDKRCMWGIDNLGVFHDLSRKQKFKCKYLKPYEITQNKYIWFKTITKPFEVPFSIKNIEEDIMYYWFKLIYIDNVWEIGAIDTDYSTQTTVEL